jgi:hypothetical protein
VKSVNKRITGVRFSPGYKILQHISCELFISIVWQKIDPIAIYWKLKNEVAKKHN